MAPCFWLRTDYMISIKDLCVFPCCHNNAVQRGIIAAPPAQANQIYCLTAHHKTKVKNIDLILMHVSLQKNISQLRKYCWIDRCITHFSCYHPKNIRSKNTKCCINYKTSNNRNGKIFIHNKFFVRVHV